MEQTIRIATWNLGYGIDLPEIISSIQKDRSFADLDFFMLQEASVHYQKEDAAIIAQQLGEHYTHFQVTAQTFKGIPQANALIWNTQKITVDNMEALEMPPFHSGSRLHAPFKKIRDTERTLAMFLKKSILQRRISLVIEGKIYGHTFRLYVVHFDLIGLASRKKQMDFLLKDSEEKKKADIEIIAGDVNTFRYLKFPTWSGMSNIAEDAGFKDLSADIQWTFRDKHFPQKFPSKHKLDAIFIRAQIPFHYVCRSVDMPGSDHIPVFADVTVTTGVSR